MRNKYLERANKTLHNLRNRDDNAWVKPRSLLLVISSIFWGAFCLGVSNRCLIELNENPAAPVQTISIFSEMIRVAEERHVDRNGYNVGNYQFIKAAIKERKGFFVLPSRIKKSEENFTQKGIIDEELVPNPEIRPLLQEVYDAFRSRNQSAEFYAALYHRMLTSAPESEDSVTTPNKLRQIPQAHAQRAIWDYAKELGFEKEFEIFAEDVVPTHEFRERVLDPNQVIIDKSPTRLSEVHGRYSHYLQMIYARKVLNEKFGPQAYSKMIEYFKTNEGYKLWLLLFDYGPDRMSNASYPRFFTESRIAYQLGLD